VREYSQELAEKPHCVVFTKLDLLGEDYVPGHRCAGQLRRVRDQRRRPRGARRVLQAWWSQLLALRPRHGAARRRRRAAVAVGAFGPARAATLSRPTRALSPRRASGPEGALALLYLPAWVPHVARPGRRAPGRPRCGRGRTRRLERRWAAARRWARATLADAESRSLALYLPGDPGYPASLLDLPDPPVTLYALGDATHMSRGPRVAVVGTRQYTPLGERTTRRVVAALRDANAVVVSGLARGIDTVAHAAALAEGLPTVAVLGTGVDVPYPAGNAALHARIASEGCVAAEAPPGATATRGAFPRRNRIVAALADLVVVVEAGAQSGALITAGIAADLGRPVAAAPGSVEARARRAPTSCSATAHTCWQTPPTCSTCSD
jgi:DNA protecting protein DprA